MRYAYGVTTALLLGGAALSLATGLPAGAQVAQNEASQMQNVVPRAGAPASFAELTQQLQPAVVNISTRQRVRVQAANPFAGTPFEGLFGGAPGQGQGPQTRDHVCRAIAVADRPPGGLACTVDVGRLGAEHPKPRACVGDDA